MECILVLQYSIDVYVYKIFFTFLSGRECVFFLQDVLRIVALKG
jgi:hypothetical protein